MNIKIMTKIRNRLFKIKNTSNSLLFYKKSITYYFEK